MSKDKKHTEPPEIVLDPRKMRMVDAWYWAEFSKIKLGSGTFSTRGHEYEIGPLQEDHPNQCGKKGAQMGWTEMCVLKTLWGHIYRRYPQGTLYLFPTWNDVTDFSKGRFNPLIYDNPEIARYVKGESIAKATEAATIKRIGGSMLYLRSARETGKIQGAKGTSSALKSVPVDRLVFDERDEMSDDMVALALERLSHSKIKEVFQLSTPTIPDYGIDALYERSDQRVWMIKCDSCGTETCLELEFPNCVKENDKGIFYRACKKCGGEIYPRNGTWVALYPDRKDLVGWWISQLNSIYVDPGLILGAYHDPEAYGMTIHEVHNSKLGMAYIEAENRLTQNDVLRCCGRESNGQVSRGTSAGMGVDVGKQLHVVIGTREVDSYKVLFVGRVPDFNDLHDIAARYRVKSCVIDMEPETRKARDFQEAEDFKVFLCDYQERIKVFQRRDEQRGTVVVKRTEICDRSHEVVTIVGKLQIPRRCSEIEQFSQEMSNIAKSLEEDKVTGSKIYRYRKLGPDHYRHAFNYFLLACDDPSVTYPIPDAWEIQGVANADKKRHDDYDPLHR